MVLVYVFVQGWTVDPNVYSFLYQPHEVLKPQDPQTLGGLVYTPSTEHQGLHTTTERCKAPTR